MARTLIRVGLVITAADESHAGVLAGGGASPFRSPVGEGDQGCLVGDAPDTPT